jgi:L-alanine-DL-glutamate epimerase-like enolase superfamily enzyme
MAIESARVPADFRIAKIEVIPLRLWLKFKRAISRRQNVETPNVEWVDNPVVVRVETASGCSGYARVRVPSSWLGETTTSIVGAVRDYFAPQLIGASLLDREANIAALEALLPGNPAALSAIDTAIHDALGKTLGLPIYSLLGGSAEPVPLDWSVSLRPAERRDETIAEVRKAVEQYGVKILCLKFGPRDTWRTDVDTFRAVRAAVGNDVEIGIDPNEGYDLPTAVRVLRLLADDGVAYVEQPFHRDHLADLIDLRAQAAVPIYLDEGAVTLADALEVIQRRAADGIVLKMWKTGSFTKTMKMAAIAEAAGLGVTVGGTAQGNLLEAACFAHVCAAAPGRVMAGEFVLGMDVTEDHDPIATAPPEFAIRDGNAQLPNGAGLGIEVNIDAARELALARYTIS